MQDRRGSRRQIKHAQAEKLEWETEKEKEGKQ